jgi:hypothetical protein
VTINVADEIAYQAGATGFSFQLNAVSTTTAPIAVQQFTIGLSGNELQWVINLFAPSTGLQTSPKGAGSGNLAALSDPRIPAGYQLRISLQSNSNGSISGAAFVAIDNHGKMLGNPVTQSLTSLSDPVPSTDFSPVVAFQVTLVGLEHGESVVLSSGSGSIVYEAKGGLAVTNSWPCGIGGSTVENANSSYGALTSGPGNIFSQAFGVSN